VAKVVLVTGSRDHSIPDLARSALWRALDYLQPDLVLNGGARGTDTWAKEWCDNRAVTCETFRPNPDELRDCGVKGQYLCRNTRMVENLLTYDSHYHQRLVLAHPDNLRLLSSGTKDTIEKAINADLDVLVIS